MIENFSERNSGIIDVSSVNIIIDKLNMYIDNEEKILLNIEKTLSTLKNYYSSDNDGLLNLKRNNLYDSFDIILENKKRYVEYLNHIVEQYVSMDGINMINYNSDIN